MSRKLTGKSSLTSLWIRWYVFATVVGWPIYVLLEPMGKHVIIGGFVAATVIAAGLSIVMRIWGSMVNGDSPDYRAWLAAGGSPFFDTLYWPLNPDPPHVRAAIGVPPPSAHCQTCGASLAGFFGLGGNYGNCCNQCGNYNDKFGMIDVGG